MIRLILLSLVLFQFMLVDAQIDGNLPYRISLDLVASGFSNPTDIANAGDERLFIVERRGRIRILNQDGSINPTPFLDIDARVVNTGGQSEQGLLSLEFHHSFESTGWFSFIIRTIVGTQWCPDFLLTLLILTSPYLIAKRLFSPWINPSQITMGGL